MNLKFLFAGETLVGAEKVILIDKVEINVTRALFNPNHNRSHKSTEGPTSNNNHASQHKQAHTVEMVDVCSDSSTNNSTNMNAVTGVTLDTQKPISQFIQIRFHDGFDVLGSAQASAQALELTTAQVMMMSDEEELVHMTSNVKANFKFAFDIDFPVNSSRIQHSMKVVPSHPS